MQPALRGLDRGRAEAVFALLDGVIKARVDDGFPGDDRLGDVVAQAPADAVAAASGGEIIHGAGVKGVFAVHKLGVQDAVALVRRGRFQIRQAFPLFQVPGAGEAATGHGGGQVAGPESSCRSAQNSP